MEDVNTSIEWVVDECTNQKLWISVAINEL